MSRMTLGMDTSGRPLVVDDRTVAKLRLAEARLGFEFTIVQGSWRGTSGAAASAGTHDRGGVIDLRTWNIPASIGVSRAVLELRKAGLIAWYRDQTHGFDPHIHAIDYGNPDLSPSAARQVTSWEAGRNGLASNGYDDGPRVTIPRDPPEDIMTPQDFDTIRELVRAEIQAAEPRIAEQTALELAKVNMGTAKAPLSLRNAIRRLTGSGTTGAHEAPKE